MDTKRKDDLCFDETTTESEEPMITIFPDEAPADSQNEEYVLKAVSYRKNLNLEDEPERPTSTEIESTPKRAFSFAAKISLYFMFLPAILLNDLNPSYKEHYDIPAQFAGFAKFFTVSTTCAGLLFILLSLTSQYSRFKHRDSKNNEPFASKTSYILSISSAVFSFLSVIISLIKFCSSYVFFDTLYLLNVAACAICSFAFFKAVRDSKPSSIAIAAAVLAFILPLFFIALYIYSWITAAV